MESAESQLDKRKKRSHVSKACMSCQMQHVSCDYARPCTRCVERHRECVEGESRRKGKKLNKQEDPSPPQTGEISALLNTNLESFPNNIQMGNPDIPGDCAFDLSVDIFNEMFLSQYKMDLIENTEVPQHKILNQEFFNKVEETITRKLPERTWFLQAIRRWRQAPSDRWKALAVPEPEFIALIESFTKTFDRLGIASIIWEARGGIIRYVNQAYKDATGFNTPLPTPLEALAIVEEMSTEGLRAYLDATLLAFGLEGYSNTFTFKTGLKLVQNPGSYLEGMMCVSIQRDSAKIPLLFCGNFIPLPSK